MRNAALNKHAVLMVLMTALAVASAMILALTPDRLIFLKQAMENGPGIGIIGVAIFYLTMVYIDYKVEQRHLWKRAVRSTKEVTRRQLTGDGYCTEVGRMEDGTAWSRIHKIE